MTLEQLEKEYPIGTYFWDVWESDCRRPSRNPIRDGNYYNFFVRLKGKAPKELSASFYKIKEYKEVGQNQYIAISYDDMGREIGISGSSYFLISTKTNNFKDMFEELKTVFPKYKDGTIIEGIPIYAL